MRSAEGLLRRARNLLGPPKLPSEGGCLSALIEAVRDQTRTVDLKHINRVLMQPPLATSSFSSTTASSSRRRIRLRRAGFGVTGWRWPDRDLAGNTMFTRGVAVGEDGRLPEGPP